jgi:Ethylbenzene dehydrogenase
MVKNMEGLLMKKFTGLFLLIILQFSVLLKPSVAQFFDEPLTAVQVETPPIVDGIADDDAWQQATPLITEVEDGRIGRIDVTLRAVYTADTLYFLVEWPDETESVTDIEAGDRLALMWQITEIVGFDVTGCNQACHDGFPEGMWFEDEGERADLWDWKATNADIMDDRYTGFSTGEEWTYYDPGDLESGSRADLDARGVWSDGLWTLELSRALDTGANAIGEDGDPIDITFEPGMPYFFGVGVMDDTLTNHSTNTFSIGFIMGGDVPEASGDSGTTSDTLVDGDVHYDEVIANRVDTPPVIDGIADEDVWASNDVSIVNINGGAIRRIDATIQAVYDSQNLYMVVQWPDDTESIDRRAWVYTRDGWERGGKEDRFSILWQITEIEGFDTIGCNIACHDDDPPIGMWLNNEGEYGDLWGWKAARTNPMGYVDDGWMGAYSGHEDGGRYVDPGVSSYARNEIPPGDVPGFIWGDLDAMSILPAVDADHATNFLLNVDVVPIDALMDFSPGDTVPGYVLRQPSGSRADIQASGIWQDGLWTVELVRALDTGSNAFLADGTTPIDVIFVPGETYFFSLVVMDNTDQDHSTEEIGIALRLVE